jgi:steroid delta-isomerase
MSVTPMPSSRTDVAHQAMPLFVAYFENLQAQNLPELARFYAREAHFKDPFNEVQGLLAIEAIFLHMFRTLDLPHFVVKERMAQGQQAFLTWDFRFRFKGQPNWQLIHGATRLQFDAQGLVVEHRDYWDAAEELYEKLPLLGALMRWLKRRVMS